MPAADSSIQEDSGHVLAGHVLGCPLSLGQVPAGVKAWLVRRWLSAPLEPPEEVAETAEEIAETAEIIKTTNTTKIRRDFRVRVQTAADAPHVQDWRQQPRQERVLPLLGQQVIVGQLSRQHVRIAVMGDGLGTVVWLELTDQQATLTLDTATLDTADTANTNNQPDTQPDTHADIELEAAERGVWRGALSPYPLVIALHEALRTAGWVPVHGACALPPVSSASAAGAVLFLGASGTGKTTTLMRALQAGWGFVAEDVLWVNAETLAVRSLERGVRLFADDIGQLEPRLAGADMGELVMGKAFIAKETLAELYGSPPRKDTARKDTARKDTARKDTARKGAPRLQHVVQLVRDKEQTAAKTAWHALNKQQAAVALWQGVGLPLTAPVQTRVAEWLPHWLGHVDAWQLTLGDDVREVLAAGVPGAS